ncbi:MAG TPA: DUF1580 domain-containing protein [Planctomycetaceae bacterium]
MNLLDETLISLTEAAKELPGRPHIATVHRFASKGARGHVLETVTCGGRRFTSREATRRFLTAQNSPKRNLGGGGFSSPVRPRDELADRELRRLGL